MTTRYDYHPNKDLPPGLTRWLFNIVKGCKGAEKAITRERINELLLKYHNTEVTERALRRLSEKIRRTGVRLCDLEDGSGLFIARTEEEYTAFKIRYTAHALSLIKTVRAMDTGTSATEVDASFDEFVAGMKPVQKSLF